VTNPWDGPRHRSWASNTVLTLICLIVVLVATVVTDYFGEPPTYLVALLGTAAGAFFTAIGSDKYKREIETREDAREAKTTADRAEAKSDKLAEFAEREHPGDGVRDEPPFNPPKGGGGG
jgi:hypothetical protein